MPTVAYVSEVQLERVSGPLRIAHLPGEPSPVFFSTHGAVAEHYGISPESLTESHATTLDYIVAAAGGWLLGTFAGALAARKIDADHGKVKALARGEVENDGGVLVIKRIHVEFTLAAPESGRSTVERVHKVFAEKCPVYRSVKAAIQITTSFHLVETGSWAAEPFAANDARDRR